MTERRGSKVKLKRQIFHGKLDNPTILPICIFYLSDLYYCISIIQLGSNAQKLDVYFRCPSWSSCGADHNHSYGVKIIVIRWAWSIMWRIFFHIAFENASKSDTTHICFNLFSYNVEINFEVIHNEAKSPNCRIWELG